MHARDLRVDLGQDFAFLPRLRAGEEIKHPRIEPQHPAGAHKIREAFFLPHPLEQPRSHAAEQLVRDLADMVVRRMNPRAWKRLQHHRLLARLFLHEIARFRRQPDRTLSGLRRGHPAPGNLAQECLQLRHQLFWIKIARDREDHVGPDKQAPVQCPQRRRRERLYSRLVAARIERQRVRAEKFPPGEFPRERHHVVRVIGQTGELRVLFELERARLESGGEHRIGDHRQRPVEIWRQNLRRQSEAIVARERMKRPAHFLDELRDLGRAAFARILREHRRQQRRRAPLSRLLEERSARHN